MNVLFLYLNAFSAVGGIQKFNKNFINALSEIQDDLKGGIDILGLYDHKKDLPEISGFSCHTAEGNKIKYIWNSIQLAKKSDKIILGHSNLLFPIVFLLKLFYRNKEIILITHGIEIWEKFNFLKRYSLKKCDKILSVSNFTKNKITAIQNINKEKIFVFPNTIDLNFEKCAKVKDKSDYLLERYNISREDKVVFTISRLSSTEMYKGYDKVLRALPKIQKQIPKIKYVLSGKADASELERIKKLIEELGLKDSVTLTGFVKDEELMDHYALGDLFVMPSQKEGFGIVFTEALLCGKPVIGGNMDGSVDALLNGELGCLIDPNKEESLIEAITSFFAGHWPPQLTNSQFLRERTIESFGFDRFKSRLKNILL